MLKFALRRNLIYPLQLIIWNLVRKLETILIGYLFNFSNSLFYTPIMFIGEFTSGLFIYLYQKQFLKKQKEKPKFFNITLITAKTEIITPDSRVKIYLLILFIAYFDWIQFMIWTAIVPKFFKISGSIVSRLSGILTISDALFYYYVLRLAIFKHQFFSLIIIGICLIVIIITEFIFQEINIFLTYTDFIIVLIECHVPIMLNNILNSNTNKEKLEKKIKASEDNIKRFEKNIKEMEESKKENGNLITLGSILFMKTNDEILSLVGGSYEKYMKFQSAYTTHYSGVKYAIEHNKRRYNFYGITGDFNEKENPFYGLYSFKRDFGLQRRD